MEIPLFGAKAAGRVALVDDEDWELVMRHRWRVLERPLRGRWRGPYAVTSVGRSSLLMHKLITGWPMTDHVNHDGLDNRRSNLRPASATQNQANQRPKLGTSAFKGVAWHRASGKWRAAIRIDGRTVHLGLFLDEEDAARAYDAAARRVHSEYACVNFSLVTSSAH